MLVTSHDSGAEEDQKTITELNSVKEKVSSNVKTSTAKVRSTTIFDNYVHE
jgi:hypothetical protein